MIWFWLFILCILKGSSLEEIWPGKWFPHSPSEPKTGDFKDVHNSSMTNSIECDNGKINLDFNSTDPTDNLRYICLENRSAYKHDFGIQPVIKEYIIPPQYSALHKCVNESIEYEERLPTFGNHRPLWAKYGEYKFLPPQRWLHNLEHGAVVMLYHPCASFYQVEKLKMLVQNCLYRHIITPSKRTSFDRPLALLTWRKSLEMSAVDSSVVIDFIKNNALKGSEKTYRDGKYDQMLIKNSKVVSDEADNVLCPNYV